jgi:radical SAM protein with 4Fe4S-binding SPASM domain
MLVEICRLDGRGELQMKVTCGPHYERVIRQHGLYDARRIKGHSGGPVPGRSAHGGASRGCLAGLGVLFVGHQGNVFPCGYLPIDCGSILETRLARPSTGRLARLSIGGLADIWHNSKDLARMRDSEGLEGKCGLCGYRQICGGCRARAYAATGNYMAEEPFCAYIPPQATSKS